MGGLCTTPAKSRIVPPPLHNQGRVHACAPPPPVSRSGAWPRDGCAWRPAADCADEAVTARGEPARFEVLAKAKARGNWRAKVRTLPTLGAAYADWNKALAPDYRCSQQNGQHTCVAVAHPCRD